MCGIVGYVGKDEAGPVLLHGLQRLEYRGYDSSGLAVRMNNDEPIIVKAEGKLINLIEKTKDGDVEFFSYITPIKDNDNRYSAMIILSKKISECQKLMKNWKT